MFCILKYIEYSIFMKQQKEQYKTPQPGAINKQLLVHVLCPIQIILDYIFQEIGYFTGANFDLATANSDRVNIQTYPPHTSGTQVLKQKETYYLLVAENVNDKNKQLTPVLHRGSKEYLEYMAKPKSILKKGEPEKPPPPPLPEDVKPEIQKKPKEMIHDIIAKKNLSTTSVAVKPSKNISFFSVKRPRPESD